MLKAATNWGATGDILRGVGRHALHGAIPGAVIGGIGGLFNKDRDESALHAALTGAAKGGVIGGGLGAGVGHLSARADRTSRAIKELMKNDGQLGVYMSNGTFHKFVPARDMTKLPHEHVFNPERLDDRTFLYHTDTAAAKHPALWNFIEQKAAPIREALPIYPPHAPKTAFDRGFSAALNKFAAELTAKGRAQVKSFAIPDEKKYPIHDAAHARNALARVSQFGSTEDKSRVRAAVKSKFPGIEQE